MNKCLENEVYVLTIIKKFVFYCVAHLQVYEYYTSVSIFCFILV